MKPNDRAHRILTAVAGAPMRVNELKRRVADPAVRRSIDHSQTWDTCLQLAEFGLVAIHDGLVRTTAAGQVAKAETDRRAAAA